MRIGTVDLDIDAIRRKRDIPTGPGVYLLHGIDDSEVVYVGQSLRLRSRIVDHARPSSRIQGFGRKLQVTYLSIPNATREMVGIIELAMILAGGRVSAGTGPLLNRDAFEEFAADPKARSLSARKAHRTLRARRRKASMTIQA